MEERDPLTSMVIGAAIEVHRVMGPGLLDSVYQTCLDEEVRRREVTFVPQHRIPLEYEGRQLDDDFVLNFYFPNCLVVEVKAVERLMPVHEAQLLTYLRLSQTKVGLLLNFNGVTMKEGIKRMVI